MAIPSIYINLEDDVAKIVTRLERARSSQVILVCPKKCYLFSNEEFLANLKIQTDKMGKEIFILTMDERGQRMAQEAGFGLKFLPKTPGAKAISDIRPTQPTPTPALKPNQSKPIAPKTNNVRQMVRDFTGPWQAEEQPKPDKTQLQAIADEVEQKARNFIERKRDTTAPAVQASPSVKVTDAIFPPHTLPHQPITEDESGQYEYIEPKTSVGKLITGFVVLSVVVILLLVFVILPKATVVVYPRTEPVTRDMQISESSNVPAVDPAKLLLPATKIDQTTTVQDTFQSQGKLEVGNKAEGTVKIYNFTKLPLNLKASTTSLNLNGKIYNLVNDVIGLKPTTYINAQTKEVDKNSLGASVEIIAAQGGDDYNIPAGTRLEISNQVFGTKPQLLYAVSDSEITGGTTRYLSTVSQNDVSAAQIQLQNEALAQIRSQLAQKGLVLPDNDFTPKPPQFTFDNPIGSQTPNFHGSLKLEIMGLAYKQDDLTNLITQRIGQTLASNKSLAPSDASSTTVTVQSVDLNNELGVLEVHYQGQAIYSVDLPNISSELVGKSKNDANELLMSKAEIDRVDIILSPIWQKNFPWFASKIKVNVSQTPTTNQ